MKWNLKKAITTRTPSSLYTLKIWVHFYTTIPYHILNNLVLVPVFASFTGSVPKLINTPKPKLLTAQTRPKKSSWFRKGSKAQPIKLAKLTSASLFLNFINLSLSPISTDDFQPHGFHKLVFAKSGRSGHFSICTRQVYNRWNNIHQLLFNVFYFSTDVIVFGHKFFKNEIVSLNRAVINSKHFWKRYLNLVEYSTGVVGGSLTSKLLKAMRVFKIQLAFVADATLHYKTSLLLKRQDVITIGVVSYTQNPWLFTYPIPVHANGYLSQYYFIRYIYCMKQTGLSARNAEILSLWVSL